MAELERIVNLEVARPEWTALAERSGNIFSTWEWADAWWRHFGGEGELRLLRRGGEKGPLAILPLYSSQRGPLQLLRFVGHGVGDVLGPICAPEDGAAAAAALRQGLDQGLDGRSGILLAERMPPSIASAKALDGRLLQVEDSPALPTEGRTWEEYLAASSRNLREKLRRNTRKLERDHELTYRLCESRENLDATMETLFRLHALRWSDGGAFARPGAGAFHKEFAGAALDKGWLRLWTMELDGEPVAAWYGFRFGDTEAYYQSGRNPDYDRFSVGFLMLMQTIRYAFEDGLARYAFLRGDEAYKGRFATVTETLETEAVGRGALAGAALGLGSLALDVPWLRRRAIATIR